MTLRQAWERYRVSHMERKGRSEGTIDGYEDHVERLFFDWLDTPLGDLGEDPGLVADRHDKITRENGPGIANGAMRTLRAIYNHAHMSQSGADGVRWPALPSRKIGDPVRDPTPPDRRTKAYCQANPLTVEGKPRRRVGRPPSKRPAVPTPSEVIMPAARGGYQDAASPPM